MPCLAAVLSLVDVAQLDANVVGGPGVQYSASPTRHIAEVQPKVDQCSEGVKDWDWACMEAPQGERGNASACALSKRHHTLLMYKVYCKT